MFGVFSRRSYFDEVGSYFGEFGSYFGEVG